MAIRSAAPSRWASADVPTWLALRRNGASSARAPDLAASISDRMLRPSPSCDPARRETSHLLLSDPSGATARDSVPGRERLAGARRPASPTGESRMGMLCIMRVAVAGKSRRLVLQVQPVQPVARTGAPDSRSLSDAAGFRLDQIPARRSTLHARPSELVPDLGRAEASQWIPRAGQRRDVRVRNCRNRPPIGRADRQGVQYRG